MFGYLTGTTDGNCAIPIVYQEDEVSAADAFKDILGKFLTQAMIKHLLHSGAV